MVGLASQVLNQEFANFLSEEINREATLLRLVSKLPNRRDYFQWSVNVGGAIAAGVSITADAPAVSQDKIVPARIPHNTGSLQSTFIVNESEILIASEQVSETELRNLLQSYFRSAAEEIMLAINKYLYTGEGNISDGGIFGLDVAVWDSDRSPQGEVLPYAGISSQNNPVWRASIIRDLASNGTDPKPLEQATLYKMDRLIRDKGGRFDVIVTSPAGLQAYKELFDTQRTFVVNGNSIADLGFGVGEYSGVPIIDDPSVPTYLVNGKEATNFYFLKFSDLAFYSQPTEGSDGQPGPNGTIYTQMEKLAKTSLYNTKYVVGVIPQMVLRTRKNCGKIMNVAV